MVYLDSSCSLHRPLEHQSSSSYYLRNMSVIISKSIRYPLSDSRTYSCAHTMYTTQQNSLPFMLFHAERSSWQGISMLLLERPRKQIMNQSQNLPWALSSALWRKQTVREYCWLLQSASSQPPFPPSLQLSPIHLPHSPLPPPPPFFFSSSAQY